MLRLCDQLGVTTLKFPRRKFLHLAAGAAAFPVVTRFASAEGYPSRPVHIIVGFPPGGATDVNARLIGQWLTERLGQSSRTGRVPAAILAPNWSLMPSRTAIRSCWSGHRP